jgi:hypothetical protein
MPDQSQTPQDEINYAKENIALFLPALIYFTDYPDFPWKKINAIFNEKVEERTAQAQGETITVQATIFDIIIAAKKGNKTAKGLLLYLNHLFHDLSQILTVTDRQMVLKNIKSMLTRLDWRFYDYVGEIGILYNLLATNKYRLLNVEEVQDNGKTIDFTVLVLGTSEVQLVEVLNIHLDSEKVETDPSAIKTFLTKRLSDKIADKQKKQDSPVEFTLVPVIWGGVKDLRIYSQFFQEHQLELPNVYEPFAWLQFSDDNDYYAHRFSRLKNLFDDFDILPRRITCPINQ